MINKIKLAMLAIETNNTYPIAQNFHFYKNRVQATNTKITIDCPLKTKQNFTVNAERFSSVLQLYESGFQVTDIDNYVQITKDKSQCKIAKHSEHDNFPLKILPKAQPNQIIKNGAKFLSALKTTAAFAGDDASNPYTCTVLIQDGYMYATSNSTAVRVDCTDVVPSNFGEDIQVPTFAIHALAAFEDTLIAVISQDNGLYFVFASGAWLFCIDYNQTWPDVPQLLKQVYPGSESEIPSVPDNFESIVGKIASAAKFIEGVPTICFSGNEVHTNKQDGSFELSFTTEMNFGNAYFNASKMHQIAKVAKRIDTRRYPKHVPFAGDEIIGVVMGIELVQ